MNIGYWTRILASLLALSLFGLLTAGQGQRAYVAKDGPAQAATAGPIRIPDRPTTALFKGHQGKQRTEIHFDPATGMVTLKLVVQDANGFFIPNIQRDNFVVYENGVRQNNATVEVEHALVSVALLLEHGGRYPSLNEVLATEVSLAASQLLELTGREDKIAVWKYADWPQLLADFSDDHEKLSDLFRTWQPPGVSEANLYDALAGVFDRMALVEGRKAIVLISSGVDTFSKTRYEDVLNKARTSNTPVHVIGLGTIVREMAETPGKVAPTARFDWKRVEHDLQEIAEASGGRFYSPAATISLPAIYDDLIENLKVRYMITYNSSTSGDLNSPRSVRVELVDPKTGGPLPILDGSGRTIPGHVIIQDSYVPAKAVK